MKLFKFSGLGQHCAAILAIFVLLTLATFAFAGALSTETDNLEKAMEDVEEDLGIKITVLTNLNTQMWLLRHEWGHVDAALRDAGINALSDVLQTDFINIIIQLWKSQVGLKIR